MNNYCQLHNPKFGHFKVLVTKEYFTVSHSAYERSDCMPENGGNLMFHLKHLFYLLIQISNFCFISWKIHKLKLTVIHDNNNKKRVSKEIKEKRNLKEYAL